jgi:predicted transcriptional regulator
MLDIAPSAVSQYLSGKRGYRIEFEDDVKKTIGKLAQDLIDKKQVNVIERICGICRQLREGEGGCAGLVSESCGL